MDQQQAAAAGSGISSGFLRTKISLKGNQSQLSLVSPFYGMKPELPPQSQLLGSDDLIALFDLSGAYSRYCGVKKPRDDLASFLPHVCAGSHINKKADSQCSLRKLIEDPPIMGREINNLTSTQLNGFKLTPGPIPDANRFFDLPEQPTSSSGGTTTTTFLPHSASAPLFESQSAATDERRQRKRIKRSLDELTLDDVDRKAKKAKGGGPEENGGREKEKKRKKEKKKKKKDREKRAEDEGAKRSGGETKRETVMPFF